MAIGVSRKIPSERELRWFGLLLLSVFAALGGVAILLFGSPRAAVALWATGAVLAVVHAVLRPLRRPIYHAWMTLVFPIGWTISHLVLVVVYYGIITPIALGGRIFGRDKLERRFDRSSESYWVDYEPGGDTARYFRQS
jgi:hypothetical protein